MLRKTLNGVLATLPFSRIAQRGEEGSRNYRLEFIAPAQKTNSCQKHSVLCMQARRETAAQAYREQSLRSTFPFSIELFNGCIRIPETQYLYFNEAFPMEKGVNNCGFLAFCECVPKDLWLIGRCLPRGSAQAIWCLTFYTALGEDRAGRILTRDFEEHCGALHSNHFEG